MKKNIYLLLMCCFYLLLTTKIRAQAPQGINYQTVIRDKSGAVLAEKATTLSFEFILGAPTGVVVYTEQHQTNTSKFGVVNLVLGKGINPNGKFSDIPWGNGDIYLKVMVDGAELGTIQLMSVPYAMYALKAAEVDNPQSAVAWLVGTGLPSFSQGKPQDLYLNSSSGEFFQKEQNVWVSKGNLRGPTGLKGDTGAKGDKGDKGDQGIAGVAGPKGDKGDKGETGPIGLTGAKGDKGDPGATGAAGPKGDKGEIGPIGLTGAKGDKGDPGATGAAGPKGDKGDIGPIGLTGAKGDKGDPGNTGAAGPKGDKGEIGPIGLTGAKGDKGDTGDTGAAGSKGDKGEIGPIGLTGAKGDKGDPGATGAAGPKGDKGEIGPIGLTGAKGDKGDKGDTGATGPAGISILSGDVTGNASSSKVVALQNRSIATTAPNPNQVLKWNGSQWAPGTDNTGGGGGSFDFCGELKSPLTNKRVSIGECPQFDALLEVTSKSLANGINVDLDATNVNIEAVKGLRVAAAGGSNANDGVIIFSRSGNRATGMKIASSSDNQESIGLFIAAGGEESSLISPPSITRDQNYGIYIDLQNNSNNDGQGHSKRDMGLFVRNRNDADYAAYFDGDVAIPRELEFINPNNSGNGQRWALFINKSNQSIGSCGSISNDFIFEYENSIKGVLDNSSGAFCSTSDRRVKKDINSLSPILNSLKNLNPVSYTYISDEDEKRQIGFIAQEVEMLFPELINIVPNDKFDDFRTLNYSGFSVIAIKAIQEQQAIIETQKDQLAAQEDRLKHLEAEMAQMKQMLLQSLQSNASEKASAAKTDKNN